LPSLQHRPLRRLQLEARRDLRSLHCDVPRRSNGRGSHSRECCQRANAPGSGRKTTWCATGTPAGRAPCRGSTAFCAGSADTDSPTQAILRNNQVGTRSRRPRCRTCGRGSDSAPRGAARRQCGSDSRNSDPCPGWDSGEPSAHDHLELPDLEIRRVRLRIRLTRLPVEAPNAVIR
jgi:hypothetical protein